MSTVQLVGVGVGCRRAGATRQPTGVAGALSGCRRVHARSPARRRVRANTGLRARPRCRGRAAKLTPHARAGCCGCVCLKRGRGTHGTALRAGTRAGCAPACFCGLRVNVRCQCVMTSHRSQCLSLISLLRHDVTTTNDCFSFFD